MDVLAELRAADPSGYEQVCYEIGEAYLFYYSVPVEKDRYAAAATWFQYAKEGYPIADMYCQISACLQNIAKYEKSEQHAKLYEEYQSLWSQILKLKTDANDFDDDLKLRIWNEITNMIQNNAKAFCEVTPPEEILAAIDEISGLPRLDRRAEPQGQFPVLPRKHRRDHQQDPLLRGDRRMRRCRNDL